MAGITSPLRFGLKHFVSKTAMSNLKLKPLSALTQRSLSTTCACYVKQIDVTEVGDQIVIEAKIVPSAREKYIAKLPTDPTGCKGCPLCRLGLTVRHTDVLIINQFINSKGKQLPREITGLCMEQHKRMDYLIVMAEKAGLIDRDVVRKIEFKGLTYYEPEEWEEPNYRKYYDETVINEFLYGPRKRH
ncbi:28S ribosomal protein S18a, mitochondrial [Orchesella cincta]|uniref:28S ribosomal protein S18a, mitochondrial n=1 Tax=Orchesella cincta TaxID=48709 RepID=A0A1D2MX22_ORCCI|nr:28S ribosomal protein S18a, mitochondrial [Orchesella cincta]